MTFLPHLFKAIGLRGALALAGVLAILAGWLYVSGLQSENSRLKADLASERQARQFVERQLVVLADEAADAQARAERSQSIKKDIYAIPASGVPADIRAALERLRDN